MTCDERKRAQQVPDPMKIMAWLRMVLLGACEGEDGANWSYVKPLDCLSDIWERETRPASTDNVTGPGNMISSLNLTRSHTAESEWVLCCHRASQLKRWNYWNVLTAQSTMPRLSPLPPPSSSPVYLFLTDLGRCVIPHNMLMLPRHRWLWITT